MARAFADRLLARWLVVLAAALLGTSASAACPVPTPGRDDLVRPAEPASYRVSRGDEINFRFFYAPELNTVATVRVDGRVALPMIGEVVAEGMTVAELAASVEQRMSAQVRRPQVVINLQGAGAQRVFVGGEVTRPGVQPLVGPLTVLQAVMVAEGLKDTAQPKSVIVLRRGPDGERTVHAVNLAAAMAGRDASQDLALQPFDVVMVPRSGIADINLWVDQYLRRTLPFTTGFSYTINRDRVPR